MLTYLWKFENLRFCYHFSCFYYHDSFILDMDVGFTNKKVNGPFVLSVIDILCWGGYSIFRLGKIHEEKLWLESQSYS